MPKDAIIDVLLESLDRAYDHSSWHGSTLRGSLRRVKAKDAAKNPHGRKSIWQQTLHAAYWKQRVLNKLTGTKRFPRQGSNWPLLPKVISEETWKTDLALLDDIHRRLLEAISKLNDAMLNPMLRKMILGIAAHDLYHAGQINLLKRLVREK